MPDVFTKEKRSEIMSRVKSRGNAATELRMIKLFKQHGISGWRRNYSIFGKPDFVFPERRIVIFVDGEFWHGHPTKAKIPKTNRAFWERKIESNKSRDRLVNRTLRAKGWIVIRIWQRNIPKPKTLKQILSALSND